MDDTIVDPEATEELPAEHTTSEPVFDPAPEADTADAPEAEAEVDEPAEDADTSEDKRTRAAPTNLQGDMKVVTDRFVTGELTEALGGKPLTPSRVSAFVHEARGGEGKAPSTGAVAAAFKRWQEYGFAEFSEKPFAFVDYTDDGRAIGLKGILDARKAERVASAPADDAPEAEAPAEGAGPDGTDAPF